MKTKSIRKCLITTACAAFAVCLTLGAVHAGTPAKAAEIGLDPANFTSAVDLAGEDASKSGYAPDQYTRYTSDDATTFWDFEGGKATNKYHFMTNDRVSDNFVYLAYKNDVQYAEIEVTLKELDTRKTDGGNSYNGWSGLYFGITDTTRKSWWPDNPHGGIFFCQADGIATYSSNVLNKGGWTDTTEPNVKNTVSGFDVHQEMTHKLKLYKGHVQYYVNGTIYWDLTAPDDYIGQGECGVAVSNQSFEVSSFKVTALTETGEVDVSKPESIELPAIKEGIEIYETVDFTPVVKPDGTSQGVSVTGDGVVYDASAHKLTFTKTGSVTLTVASSVDPQVKAEKTVTVAPQSIDESVFASIAADKIASRTETYYIEDGDPETSGALAEFSEYFSVENDTLKRTPKAEWGNVTDVSTKYTTLYFKNFPENNFVVKYDLKVDGKDSWKGLVFALANKAKAGNQEGATLFVQRDGKSTFWSGKDSPFDSIGPNQLDSKYFVASEWNTFMFKIYGGGSSYTVEMYVNDMKTPAYSNSIKGDCKGNVGLFFSAGGTSELKNLQYGYLENDGSFKQYVAVESVSFSEQSLTLKEGDEHNTTVTVLPEGATMKKVAYSTSAPGVVSVDENGKLRAQGVGEADITVTALDNDAKTSVLHVTVEKREVPVSSVTITNKDAVKNLVVGGNNVKLEVTVSPDDATDQTLSFTSSDQTVVKVTSGGTIQIIGAGTATVTVTAGDKSDSVEITVTDPNPGPGEEPGPGEDPGTDPGTDPGDTPSKPEENKGCGSAIGGGAAIGAAVLLAAGVLLAVKKRKE